MLGDSPTYLICIHAMPCIGGQPLSRWLFSSPAPSQSCLGAVPGMSGHLVVASPFGGFLSRVSERS